MDKTLKPWRMAIAFAAVFVVLTAVPACSTGKAKAEWARYLDPPPGYRFEPEVRLTVAISVAGYDFLEKILKPTR